MTSLGPSMAPVATMSAPPVPSASRSRRLVLGAVLEVLATALVVGGSILPLFSMSLSVDEFELRVEINSWRGSGDGPDLSGAVSSFAGQAPIVGAPLMFGVALLLGVAVLGMAAVVTGRSLVLARAAGAMAVVAATFLVGTVWTTGMVVSSWWSSFRLTGDIPVEYEVATEIAVGLGFWMLVAAVVVAFGVAVLLVVSASQRRPDPRLSPVGQYRVEPETPRFGFPVPAAPQWAQPENRPPAAAQIGRDEHSQWARPVSPSPAAEAEASPGASAHDGTEPESRAGGGQSEKEPPRGSAEPGSA